MIRKAFRKITIVACCAVALILGLYQFSVALEEVEEFVTASDGTKIPWGIKEGYEQSDATGKNLDPIMYYGHKPDVDKATALEIEKAWWYQIRGQYANNLYGFKGSEVEGFEAGARITKTNKRELARQLATRRSSILPVKNSSGESAILRAMSASGLFQGTIRPHCCQSVIIFASSEGR